MRNKVNEWQELSLKKDIESILKLLNKKQHVNYVLATDVSLAMVAIIADKLETVNIIAITIMFIFSLFLTIYLLCRMIYDAILKHNTTYLSFDVSKLIDMFDNEVCYYVMMAETYSQMFCESIDTEMHKSLSTFYYIETCYCINKVKSKLHCMGKKYNKVFANQTHDLQINVKCKIHVDRLINIIEIIENIRIVTNKLITDHPNIINDSSITEINKKYDEAFLDFVRNVPNSNIDVDDENRFVQC